MRKLQEKAGIKSEYVFALDSNGKLPDIEPLDGVLL